MFDGLFGPEHLLFMFFGAVAVGGCGACFYLGVRIMKAIIHKLAN